MSLREIENRIIEIKSEISQMPQNLRRPGVVQEILERQVAHAVKPLSEELEVLHIKRQFLLDQRENFFSKLLWNFLIPVVTSVITTYLLIRFGLKI